MNAPARTAGPAINSRRLISIPPPEWNRDQLYHRAFRLRAVPRHAKRHPKGWITQPFSDRLIPLSLEVNGMGKLLPLATCAIALHVALYAQFQFGSVNGLIKDPSQAPAPDSTVEIRSKSTNVAQRIVSSASGEYDFVSLPPDQYVLTITHPGFKTVTRSIQLSVDQRLQLDITLEIGNVSEQVSVT